MKEEKRLSVRLPKDLHDKFKAAVAANGKDMTEVILQFAANYVQFPHGVIKQSLLKAQETYEKGLVSPEQYEQALRGLQAHLDESTQ